MCVCVNLVGQVVEGVEQRVDEERALLQPVPLGGAGAWGGGDAEASCASKNASTSRNAGSEAVGSSWPATELLTTTGSAKTAASAGPSGAKAKSLSPMNTSAGVGKGAALLMRSITPWCSVSR